MRLEVLALMAHLVVTLGILGLYGFSLFSGHPDTTLQNLLLIIGGYWFGVVGNALNKGKDSSKGGKENE